MRILPGASRRIFHFSPSRAFPRALNDVNNPKRLGTRLQPSCVEFEVAQQAEISNVDLDYAVLTVQSQGRRDGGGGGQIAPGPEALGAPRNLMLGPSRFFG